jgi:RHS repeat-associated protein
VNNVTGKVSGNSFVTEDVTLASGANTLTATATNTAGTATTTSNVTLDTTADKLFTYDSNGSLTRTTFGTKQVNYTYDYENRVSSITQTGLPNVTYKYDYLGRRIEKNIGGTVTKYIYDGDNIIAEYDSAGTLQAKYVYGLNIDEPIRLERGATICYYHFDGLGSVTDLSNSVGAQVEHYTYSPFGKTKIYNATGLKLTDSAYGNYYRFTARQWDGESGLYYYRARYYDANLGRFLQADPVGYEAGDMNLYRYCGNNGINFLDPSGLEWKKRKDESWKDYWNRMRDNWKRRWDEGRREREQRWLEEKLQQAKRFGDLGMDAAAAKELLDYLLAKGEQYMRDSLSDSWNALKERLEWAAQKAASLTHKPGIPNPAGRPYGGGGAGAIPGPWEWGRPTHHP